MANKSVEVILSAVKSAGEAALRLHEENKQLRECLMFVRPYVYGIDNIKRIDALLTPDQQPVATDPMA